MSNHSEISRRAKTLIKRFGTRHLDSDGFGYTSAGVGPYEVIAYDGDTFTEDYSTLSIVRHDLLKMAYRESSDEVTEADPGLVANCLAEMRKSMVLDDLAEVSDE